MSTQGGDTPLHRASYMGHESICEKLIQHNADINFLNSDQQTALHRAMANNKIEATTPFTRHRPAVF